MPTDLRPLPWLDVITVGRIGIDLYPTESNVELARVALFRRFLGGSPTNVAVAGARLGLRTAVVTKVGSDPFGDYAVRRLGELGVDTRWVTRHDHFPTPLAFAELFPPDRFPLLFYRWPTAPDLMIAPGDFDLDSCATVPVLWTSGTALSREPSRHSVLAMLTARSPSALTIHDIDYRPSAWSSLAACARWNRVAARRSSVVIGNTREIKIVTGTEDPVAAAKVLLSSGVGLVVVKQGGDGVYARDTNDEVRMAGLKVHIANGLGAGDAFGGALCLGLLRGWPLQETIEFANAAGALITTRLACADDMPTEYEVRELLGRLKAAS